MPNDTIPDRLQTREQMLRGLSKEPSIPEWAREEAANILAAQLRKEMPRDILARALVAAERIGLERAAKRCDQFADVGRKLWNEAADERPDLHLAQALGAESCAAAIRKLMESSDEAC